MLFTVNFAVPRLIRITVKDQQVGTVYAALIGITGGLYKACCQRGGLAFVLNYKFQNHLLYRAGKALWSQRPLQKQVVVLHTDIQGRA